MKLTILTVVAAAAVFIGSATRAEAGPGFSIRFGGSGHGGSGHGGHSNQPYHQGYANHNYASQSYHHGSSHCAQPYKVNTVEVNRYTQCQTAYDNCGRPYTYHVTVVTYCDHYSNGETRTWTRTFS